MRKVKVGSKKKKIDYDYEEYCFAVLKYKSKYYIIKDNDTYSFIGDKIKDYEGRRECIERILKERCNIVTDSYEEYLTIDEYNDLELNHGLENFTTYYLVFIDKELDYNKVSNEELLLVSSNELKESINVSYQKEALKIMFMIK